ncbi:MAG: flavoprotein [Bacillota bacterium]|nr:flavoprotein [Bacillota bacterium]
MELQGFNNTILQEALRQLNASNSTGTSKQATTKKYLIVVTGGEWGIPQAISFVNQCVMKQIPISLVLSNSALKLVNKDEWIRRTGLMQIITDASPVTVMELLKEHEQIVVPILTVNSAAKVAMGIADTLASNIIFQGLLMAKPILAAKESCNLNYISYYNKKENQGAGALEALVKGHQQSLEQMGVKFLQASDILELVSPKNKAGINSDRESNNKDALNIMTAKVITEDDIRGIEPGAVIKTSRSTIITPLAKDLALEKGIKFSK